MSSRLDRIRERLHPSLRARLIDHASADLRDLLAVAEAAKEEQRTRNAKYPCTEHEREMGYQPCADEWEHRHDHQRAVDALDAALAVLDGEGQA